MLEVGGVAAVEQADGSAHFGGSVAVEKTAIENWLELELGLAITSGAGERELARLVRRAGLRDHLPARQ